MDALVLPALGVLIACFLVVVWSTWLGDKQGRALAPAEDEETEEPSVRR